MSERKFEHFLHMCLAWWRFGCQRKHTKSFKHFVELTANFLIIFTSHSSQNNSTFHTIPITDLNKHRNTAANYFSQINIETWSDVHSLSIKICVVGLPGPTRDIHSKQFSIEARKTSPSADSSRASTVEPRVSHFTYENVFWIFMLVFGFLLKNNSFLFDSLCLQPSKAATNKRTNSLLADVKKLKCKSIGNISLRGSWSEEEKNLLRNFSGKYAYISVSCRVGLTA